MANTDFNADEGTDFGAGQTAAGAVAVPAVTGPTTWSKLGIVNEALINTGNNIVQLNRDVQSDEWIAASSIFDQEMRTLAYRRDWKFMTQIAGLPRVGASSFPGYADIFAKPANCLFLVNCWRSDLAALILPSFFGTPSELYDTAPPALDYQVIGDQVHTTGPPVGSFAPAFNFSFDTTTGVIAKFLPFPDPSQPWSVGFVAVLRMRLEAGLYRALNEDMSACSAMTKLAEEALVEASSRNDQEEPRKVAFRSRIGERRRQSRYGWGNGW